MSRERVDLRWPADRFYWAVLDTSRLPAAAGRRRDVQLGYLFESMLPGIPIEDVHTVYHRLPGQRVLACGVPTETMASINGPTMTLAPAAAPDFLEDEVDLDDLNLLSGRFAPASVKRARRLAAVCGLALVMVAVVLLVVGLERRRSTFLDHAADLRAERRAMIAPVVDGAADASLAQLELQLEGLRRRLDQTRVRPAGATAPFHADLALGDLLAVWPQGVTVRTHEIVVKEGVITVTAAVDAQESQPIVQDALEKMPAWQVDEQSLNEDGDEFRVWWRFVPADEEGAP